jgi:hypothetical protein
VRLYAKPIKNFANINQFDYATEWNVRKDEDNSLYFQLVDLDQDGLRYLPTDPSYSVVVTFPSLNTAGTLVKSAVQASPLDNSIWRVDLSSTEVPFSGNVQFALTEGTKVRRFSLIDGIVVEGVDNGGC